MEKFGRSQSVKRVEDLRFVTGRGQYIDDVAPAGAYVAKFLRAPVAHAVITELDVSDAREAPGVIAVYTAADLEAAGVVPVMHGYIATSNDGSTGFDAERPLLVRQKMRYVGDPIALVIAETKQQATDAIELIALDYEELEPHMEVAPGGTPLFEGAAENVAIDWNLGNKQAVDAAFASAAHVVETVIEDNRVMASSMEPRGCYAAFEDGRLHMGFSGQGVWDLRNQLASHLGMQAEDVRVTCPDVGGGFGMKAFVYPEYLTVAHAARALGHPVRWMSERTEAMLTDNAGRDLVSTARMAFNEDYKLIGYSVDSVFNMGAYNSGFAQSIQTELFSKVAPGTYDVQAVHLHAVGVYTNTAPVDAYRGAGRPEAIFVIERAMDNAARVLGVDPFELRRKNFIPPNAFPYTSATGVTYDVGNFRQVLDRAADEADIAGLEARKAESAARGKLRGMGLSYYIESILGNPSETTRVDFNADGTASIFVGTQSNGQGHETVFPQFLSDHTGIPFDKINFIQGDTDKIEIGGGTGGSRSVTVQNTATLATVEHMIAAFSVYLAEKEGVSEADVLFDDQQFRIKGSNLTPTMLEAAEMARGDGRDDLLTHSKRITLEGRSFPNGAHIAELEIDPETGVVVVDRYTIVDDFGVLINPMLVLGQVHGGVVQGLGQALFERVVYDEDGQLLTASYMDYGMPRASDVPQIAFTSLPTPSTLNPMGMKGCGEAGTVGALAALANAVVDATGKQVQMPFTPSRVWEALQNS